MSAEWHLSDTDHAHVFPGWDLYDTALVLYHITNGT